MSMIDDQNGLPAPSYINKYTSLLAFFLRFA